MKRLLRGAILGLLIFFPYTAFSASTPFVPPSGKTLLLVGQDRDTIAYYVHGIGSIPGGTMLYTSIQKMEGLHEPVDYGSGSMDGDDLLRTYPNSVIQVGLYMVDGLDNTLAGKYDGNLLALAQWIIDANRPVYLRIGYEFDNFSNAYDPQKYIQTFRYVVDFLRRAGVTNAAYVWHSDGVDHNGRQWMDWYPGDDYVDWFGISLFSTQQIPKATTFLKLARSHGKPFMISESTPWGIYSIRGKIDWFTHIFQFIKDNQVNAFCYINSNWDTLPMYQGQQIGDERVEKHIETKDLWLKEISQNYYLKASPDLFRSLGWTKSRS